MTAYLIAGLVPVSVSSDISAHDLLNPAGLYAQLHAATGDALPERAAAGVSATADAKAKKEQTVQQVGRHVVASFSPEARDLLHQFGQAYQRAVQAKAPASDDQKKPTLTNEEVAALLTPGMSDTLAAELNRAIHTEGFFSAQDADELALPAEGKRYREELRAGRTLETPQLARFNRLVLEAAYPAHIRKVYGAGWRPVMLIFGTVGLLVAALYWFCLRNRPQDHPRCNEAERELIAQGRPAEVTRPDGQAGHAPLSSLVTNGNLWLANVSMFFTNVGWVFLVTWMPRYFEEVHYIPVEMRGWIGFIPLAAGAVAMFFGGWLTDALVRRIGLRWGRALPMGLSRFAAMAAYLYCLTHPQSYWSVVAALAAVAVFTDLGIGAIWAYCQDVGGRNVGSVLGWTNMWGNFGAAVGPIVVGWLTSEWLVGPQYRWDAAFIVCAVSFGISGVTALAVDARRPALAESHTAPSSGV